jgi:hypothetical protein
MEIGKKGEDDMKSTKMTKMMKNLLFVISLMSVMGTWAVSPQAQAAKYERQIEQMYNGTQTSPAALQGNNAALDAQIETLQNILTYMQAQPASVQAICSPGYINAIIADYEKAKSK